MGTAGGNAQQIKYMVHLGTIRPLIQIVEFSNPKTLRVALEGLENILKSGQDNCGPGETNPYVSFVEECNGFEIIARHGDGMNQSILDKVHRILPYCQEIRNREHG